MNMRKWGGVRFLFLIISILLTQCLSGTGLAQQPDEQTEGYRMFIPVVSSYSFIPSHGELDPTFNEFGIVGINNGKGYAVVVQPDGKIVLTGMAYVGDNDSLIVVARLNSDGSRDISFGTNGVVRTNIKPSFEWPEAIALQPDGKILVAGGAETVALSDFLLARYNPDGSLDTTFSDNGSLNTDFFGGGDGGFGLLIQPDGKIVVAGFAQDYSDSAFALARYNLDGSLDESFGVSGKITGDFSNSTHDVGLSVVMQPDGKLVVAGYSASGYSGNSDMAVARFTSTGFLDVTFGGDGWVTTDFYGSADVAFELMLQKDGKMVLVGYTNIVRNGKYETDFALARYHPDGSLDTNYGDNGKVSSDFLFYDMARAAVMQPDGKVIAVGEADVDTDVSKPSLFVVARYNLDGSLDTSFDLDGWLLTDVSQYDDEGKGITMQPDGRIVVVGFSGDDIAVVRYK